ncbi:hypothetical protein D5086_014729 [Populus alba]|uniref:Uncharacterized protein n=1 Tax=Populus alba TaxID=43335 RepID=A0ACC4C164_POPAL
MADKSKILLIGGTGYIGKFIVEASIKEGHPTFVLVRESTLSSPAKSIVINNFKNLGVNFLIGDLLDHESLAKAIKQVDVVISSIAHDQVDNQVNIIAAIKEAGNIKVALNQRSSGGPGSFLHSHVQASSIRSTAVTTTSNQPGATASHGDRLVILGDGNVKVVFNKEEDIATYTIKAVDDPRTVNKILNIKPPANIISSNDLVSLWEKKIGKTIERVYVPEEQILKNIQETSDFRRKLTLAICHSCFVNGDQTNFEIEPSFGVEASELYPDVKYTTVEEYLNQLVYRH